MPPSRSHGDLRRHLLRAGGAGSAYLALIASGLLAPTRVLAAEWQRPAFTATNFADALKAHGSQTSSEHREITFNAPEIAENGAQVVVDITSNLPDTQSIAIFVEKNPMPLAATFNFANGALPQVRVPLKMAETSRVRAVIRTADGKRWHAQREIKVTLGGCAG
ncbi:MAG: thiosulfate oxidation carrier protein SoxY [Rhodocyclaceae bacterium]|jgi:sulfur-oxidizing protein SoxY|nr:thiosulfate oxidation carrier protein SoxY [Rhodocyclaceae bacterium]